jgi:hypothetical protein
LAALLPGRTISELMRDGEKVERAFLPELRMHLVHELQVEIERGRGETLEQGDGAPKRPSRKVQRLRDFIERVDERLAILEAHAAPGAM